MGTDERGNGPLSDIDSGTTSTVALAPAPERLALGPRGAGPIGMPAGTPRQRRAAGLAAAVTAIPVVISLISLHGRRWVPAGDESVISYHVRQLIHGHPQFVGVYSTHGWAHPGPALYYLLAPGYWLLGRNPIALFQSAALLTMVAIGLSAWLAWRRRGLVGVAVACAFVSTLLLGMQPSIYVQIWNPFVPLLFFFAFLLGCWGLAERDWSLLPVTAVLASLVFQLHVGYLPLVAGALITVAGIVWLPVRTRQAFAGIGRRRLARTGGLLAVLWVLPLWDLAFGSHNLARVAHYFVTGHGGTAVGLGPGIGLMGAHVGPNGPWSGGAERQVFANVVPGGVGWLILLTSMLLVASGFHRRRTGRPAPLATLALVQLAAGCLAAAKVEPPVLSYLLAWTAPLTAFCWFSLAMTTVDTWSEPSDGPRFDRVRSLAIVVAIGVLLVQTGRLASVAGDLSLPRQASAPAVTSVLAQMHGRPLGTVRIEEVGDDFNEGWVGVVYGMDRAGVRFYTSDGANGQKWGRAHAWHGQQTDRFVTIATSPPTKFEDAVEQCQYTPGVHQVAMYDRLTRAERVQLKQLQIQLYMFHGHLRPLKQIALERLSARSYRLAVFEGDRLCGGA